LFSFSNFNNYDKGKISKELGDSFVAQVHFVGNNASSLKQGQSANDEYSSIVG